jgi:hypothetical protein
MQPVKRTPLVRKTALTAKRRTVRRSEMERKREPRARGDAPRPPSEGAQLLKRMQQNFREDVRWFRGETCVARVSTWDPKVGACDGPVEADHVWERSQGGPYLVANGSPLCRRHHRMKTDNELRYRFEWLGRDQVRWFAEVGFVAWDLETGEPYGKGWRTFEPLRPSQLAALRASGSLPALTR